MPLQQEITEALKNQKGTIAWNAEELSDLQKNNLPSHWMNVLDTEDMPAKLESLWKPWLPFLTSDDQRDTFDALQKSLLALAIHTSEEGVSCLLYVFRYTSERLCFRFGYAPLKEPTPLLHKYWSTIPPVIRVFYEEIHNGWISPFSKDGGPSPAEKIVPVDLKKYDLPASLAKEFPAPPQQCVEWYRDGNYSFMLALKDDAAVPFTFSPKYKLVLTDEIIEEAWLDSLLSMTEEWKRYH